ncbi:LytR/AlgR family response regulator transcription factor [Chitinophagaceae bacterium MMS25-I14]
MNRYSCYIIDDTSQHRVFLQSLLQEYHPEIEIIGLCSSVTEAIDAVRRKRADVIFLDIELSDGYGFEILKEIPDSTSIIITSAHTQYAFDAFSYNTVDYLAKPISIKALSRAVHKLAGNRKDKQTVMHPAQQPNENMIMVSSYNSNMEIIETRNIVFLEAEGKYTSIHLQNDKPILSSKNLKEFETILPTQFTRVHNSFIINLSHSRTFSKEELAVIMKSGEKIPVSLRKKETFLRLFQRL